MALARTGVLLRANILETLIELVLLVVVVNNGKIELVAGVVLFACLSQGIIVIPLLRRYLGIG